MSQSVNNPKKTIKSYTISGKLQILRQYDEEKKKNEKLSLRGFGKSVRINEKQLREWIKRKSQYEQLVGDPEVRIRTRRRLFGAGRPVGLASMEEEVITWINDLNTKGIRVKDKMIIFKSKQIRERMLEDEYTRARIDPDERDDDLIKKLEEFVSSNSWLDRFKSRFNLVSRRVTSSKKLPENFDLLAKDFIKRVQTTIEKFNIKKHNIYNFDQVPRYFEQTSKSTIIKKGTKSVFLVQGSAHHKRFTFTPCVSSDGRFLDPHILISNRKTRPETTENCKVSMNTTGMFNDNITFDFIKTIIMPDQKITPFAADPILIILDSYGSHLKMIKDKKNFFENRNIHFETIPGGLTGLLQPLDVALNRSYQQFHDDAYINYQQRAFHGESQLLTPSGYVKTPSYLLVSEWINDWIKTKTPEDIQKAFEICGIISKEEFDMQNLHDPLRAIFDKEFNAEIWIKNFESVIDQPTFLDNDLWIGFNDDDKNEKSQVYKCIHFVLDPKADFADWCEKTVEMILQRVKQYYFSDSIDNSEIELIASGGITGTNIEYLALSEALKFHLVINELSDKSQLIETTCFGDEKGSVKITLAHIENTDVYLLKIEEK